METELKWVIYIYMTTELTIQDPHVLVLGGRKIRDDRNKGMEKEDWLILLGYVAGGKSYGDGRPFLNHELNSYSSVLEKDKIITSDH